MAKKTQTQIQEEAAQIAVSRRVTVIPYTDSTGKKRLMKNGRSFITPAIDNKTRNGKLTYRVGFTKAEYDAEYREITGQEFDAFLDSFKIVMTEAALKLDLANPWDRMAYDIIRFHKWVCDGDEDLKNKPNARFMIVDDNKKTVQKVSKAEKKADAYVIVKQMTPIQMRDMLYFYNMSPEKMSDVNVKERLYDLIESDPATFVERYNDPQKDNYVFAYRMILSRIIQAKKGHYYYNSEFLGRSVDDVVITLDKPEGMLLKEQMFLEFSQKNN